MLTPWLAVKYYMKANDQQDDTRMPEALRQTLRNKLISALKLVIADPVGRKENTLFEPFEPEYKFLFSMAMVSELREISTRGIITMCVQQWTGWLPEP